MAHGKIKLLSYNTVTGDKIWNVYNVNNILVITLDLKCLKDIAGIALQVFRYQK